MFSILNHRLIFLRRRRIFTSGRGRIQSVFQQCRHVALDFFELIQPQGRVGNGEHVAGPGLLVNEHALAVADDLLPSP